MRCKSGPVFVFYCVSVEFSRSNQRFLYFIVLSLSLVFGLRRCEVILLLAAQSFPSIELNPFETWYDLAKAKMFRYRWFREEMSNTAAERERQSELVLLVLSKLFPQLNLVSLVFDEWIFPAVFCITRAITVKELWRIDTTWPSSFFLLVEFWPYSEFAYLSVADHMPPWITEGHQINVVGWRRGSGLESTFRLGFLFLFI